MKRLLRPLDKVLYAPLRLTAERRQGERAQALDARRASTTIRPEKRRGPVRPR